MQTTTRRSYFRNIWLITSFLYASLIAAWGSTYYVSPTGDDINGTGTSTSPFQTIQRAADLVNPGDTVIVKDGVYTTSNWGLVVLTRGGNSSAWVSFKSENKGGAVLDGQNYTTTYGFDIEPPGGSYVQIQDFEVRNFKKIAINLNWPGGNYDISGNHIHHIGRICSDEEVGYGGMYIHNVTNVVVEKNVIHDIGRFGFLENGCIPLTTYYQNHDHGVYVDGVTGITIKNNTFYNIGHGWGIHFYSGNGVRSSSILVANNTFAFPNPDRDGQIILAAPGVSDANIQNNIFYSPRTAGVRISPDSTTFTNVLISYNIVSGGTITSGSASGITVSNNMDNTDPLLVNPSLHDFHLQAGSPAINAGASLTQVTDDMDGNSRPQATYCDIGADEYIPGSITYYVSPTGNDNSPGTNSAAPFQTIQRAADLVNPGDTVIVKDGLYTRNNWGLVIITRGGNSAGWVSFKSEHKGGAVLDGQNNTTSYGFHLEPPGASYLQIQDFELRNFKKTAIDINWPPGSNYDISGNHIHHIGRICSDEEVGYGGIYLHNVTNVVVQRNTIHDIGR